ncbi:MAG: DMT family transporter [Propionivibrio sp.]
MLIGATMISFSAVWVRLADVAPSTSAFYRVFFGFCFLIVPVVVKKELAIPARHQAALVALCGVTFAADLFFWHKAIVYIGPGLATIIGNFQVFIMGAVGVIFLGERFLPRFVISVPLAVFGLFLVVGTQWQALDPQYKLGIFFGVVTACCYTLFLLTLRKIQQQGTTFFSGLMAVSMVAGLCLVPVMFAENASFAIPNLKSLLSLLALGLFSQTIGWLIIANAMPRIPASITALVLLLQPALSFVWDILFFARPTTALNLLGVVITLGAIYLGLTSRKA